MKNKVKYLGLKCLLLAILFISLGCEIPGTGNTNNNNTSNTGGATGGTTVGTTAGVSGTWEGTYTDNFTTDNMGHIGSGTLRYTFNQTNNFITGTGFTQEFGTGLTNNSTITAGQVTGNNLGMDLTQTGSTGNSSWTTTTKVSGTISGNTLTGNYRSDTIVTGSNARTYFTVGTYSLTKR
ncbi:MAG: hypothetical protein PHX78_11355 [bacterium]|nr:hypothetical protein [bacterium]